MDLCRPRTRCHDPPLSICPPSLPPLCLTIAPAPVIASSAFSAAIAEHVERNEDEPSSPLGINSVLLSSLPSESLRVHLWLFAARLHLQPPAALSLTADPGMLQMTVGKAYAFDEGLANLILRPAPDGDFDLQTHIVFLPLRDYDFAGLIVYQSRDAYLEAGRGMCRRDPGCVGDGIYMDQYSLGRPQSGGLWLAHKHGDQLFLRLQRRGRDYTLLASADGAVWSPIGTRQSDLKPAYVGLFAGQSRDGKDTALFDYFEIRQP
ncbi:MAG TPA: hypothetical protein VIU39_08945 [Anaerolineales bacterium]